MQVDQPLQFVGEMRAIFRLALGEGLFFAVIGMGKMIDAGQQRSEHLAVVDDAADRGAAEADAVIAALAADQAAPGALAVELMIGQRDLQRGIGGFRSGIAKENVVEPGGREFGDAAGELKGLRNAELKRRRIIQRLGLPGDRRRDLGAAVAGIAAPHPRGGVDDLAAVDRDVVHVLGASEQPRRLFEGPVGRERHPVRGEVVGYVDGGGSWALVQHRGLFEVLGYGGLLSLRMQRPSRKLSASAAYGNADGWLYFRLFGAVSRAGGGYRSSAPIQNTSPSDSSESSHNSGNCGNAASSLSRPRPISHNSPPSGVRCCSASCRMRRIISSPSAPPSKASFGSARHSRGSSAMPSAST